MANIDDHPRPTTVRKIYFFRINVGTADSGKPIPFDPNPILEYINTLSWKTFERYYTDPEEKITGLWIDRVEPPQRVRFGNIRRSDLPQVEDDGVLSPLFVSTNSGLADQIHVVFFSDNIVGADFNYYGPRISRLAEYMNKKAHEFFPQFICFQPLLRQDLIKKLNNFQDIRLFNLKLHTSYANLVRQADESLYGALDAARKAGLSADMEIILRPARHAKDFPSDKLLAAAKELVNSGSLRGAASRFVVRGTNQETGLIEQMDLLNDKLISKKRIVCLNERSRELDSQSAFEAIEEAYEELYPQLREAAGVGL